MADRVRMWRWHRSALRRRSDVVEGVVLMVLSVLLVAGPVLMGVLAFSSTWHTGVRQEQTRHSTPAVVVDDARAAAPSPAVRPSNGETTATVRWHDTNGTEHTQTVRLDHGGKPGEQVTLWLDQHGSPTQAPPSPAARGVQSSAAGLLAAGGAGAAVLLTRHLARERFERGHDRYWGREWMEVEPRWARRYHS
ncbi:Rv1733c family protein [Streptomyces xiamenensis]|uniref:Rv1733c family protein n=1 Tax=Streptomyces xiamenensis TaxID=408015 RepID=UPI0035D7F99B